MNLEPLKLKDIVSKALYWCPDKSGSNVDYRAGFTDKFGAKCWGTVLAGTDNVRHGFVRSVDPKNGWIREGHYQDDKAHGYYRAVYDDGRYIAGYRKEEALVGVWITYDAS